MVAGAVVAVAAGRMTVLVLRAHDLNFADYWPMLDSVLTEDGGFRAAGVFEFRNEHPVAIAKLLYWANVKVTGGSNVALGLVIVAIVLGQIVAIAALARDLGRRWPLAPALIVATAGVLLFARQGAWHFVKSMSGAAWLSANLFAVTALWAQCRGRRALAIGCAVLATVSYGTGIVTWPALLVVGFLRGDGPRRLLPVMGAGALAGAWLQYQLVSLPKSPEAPYAPIVVLPNASEIVGAFFFPGRRVTAIRVGEVILALALVAAVVAFVRVVRRRENAASAAPWIGLLVFGAGTAILVAGGRASFLWNGTAGRYIAIGALTCTGLVGAAAALVAPSHREVPAVVRGLGLLAVGALCAFVLRLGSSQANALDAAYASQDRLAVALESDLFGGSTLWLGLLEEVSADIETELHGAGASSFLRPSIDCGLLGDTIPQAELNTALPVGVDAAVTRLDPLDDSVAGALTFQGWIDGADPECVVLVDQDRTVVGAAGHGPPSRGYAEDMDPALHRVWFLGLAERRDGTTVYARLDAGDQFVALPFATT